MRQFESRPNSRTTERPRAYTVATFKVSARKCKNVLSRKGKRASAHGNPMNSKSKARPSKSDTRQAAISAAAIRIAYPTATMNAVREKNLPIVRHLYVITAWPSSILMSPTSGGSRSFSRFSGDAIIFSTAELSTDCGRGIDPSIPLMGSNFT